MNILNILNQYKYILFSAAIGIIIIIFGIIISSHLITNRNNPVPEYPDETSQFFSTTINRTTEDEVSKLPNIKEVRETEYGTEYLFPTVSSSTDNAIITYDGIVIFERKFTADSDFVHPSLKSNLDLLGEPEAILPGSRFYGKNVNYYIYSTQGITVIGRPNSDEVEEIQQYVPMSVDGYKNLWGDDILGEEKADHDHL